MHNIHICFTLKSPIGKFILQKSGDMHAYVQVYVL